MIFNTRSVIRSENISFDALLDQTCERLWDKKVQYAMRRIQELEVRLQRMEEELDVFLCQSVPDTISK
ncbi:MAG: hypothetical protein LBF75_03050 [Treponema sp.]|jgi:hypothetical protein|nr:hypothetical protein [Treponema sp.]